MNTKKVCATTETITCWEDIDFIKAEKVLKKLQRRIAVAYRNQRHDVVVTLQHQLIHSFSAKALAVQRVSSNRGKNTPGVDGVIWNTSELKFEAIHSLKRRGYQPKPLKRVFIPKGNGKLRPLSIPTMKDRAMQTLYKFALEPIAEESGDQSSYAYRQNRCARDAIAECCNILSKRPDFEWVLKIDIKSCFDSISHEWMMEHILMDKVILRKFIKTPYVRDLILYPTLSGVPQGGPLSSVLCNMTLDGLESLLYDTFGADVHMIRYADDMIIFVRHSTFPIPDVTAFIRDFLAERELELSETKTQTTHIQDGFAFLGWKIHKANQQIIATPTKTNIITLLTKIKTELSNELSVNPIKQTEKVLSIIRGWFGYYVGLADQYKLYGVEFEVMSLLDSLEDNRVVEPIKKLLDKTFQIYER